MPHTTPLCPPCTTALPFGPRGPAPSTGRLRAGCLGAALLALVAATASAQESEGPGTGQPLWEVGVFAGALSAPAYPASSQQSRRALALPYFIYRGDVLRADRSGVGARLAHTDRWELDIGFSGALPASSDDVELRRGMPDLGTLIEFGPRAKVKLAEPGPGQRIMLDVPLRAALAFGGGVRQVGLALEPRLAYERGYASGWRARTAISLLVGDQQLNQYLYGVPAAYATTTRPAFEAQGGLISTRLTLDVGKRITSDVSMFAFVRHDLHSNSANRSSPLFAQDTGTSLGLGLTWTLGRSSTRVASGP
jgi:outer membrane protein